MSQNFLTYTLPPITMPLPGRNKRSQAFGAAPTAMHPRSRYLAGLVVHLKGLIPCQIVRTEFPPETDVETINIRSEDAPKDMDISAFTVRGQKYPTYDLECKNMITGNFLKLSSDKRSILVNWALTHCAENDEYNRRIVPGPVAGKRSIEHILCDANGNWVVCPMQMVKFVYSLRTGFALGRKSIIDAAVGAKVKDPSNSYPNNYAISETPLSELCGDIIRSHTLLFLALYIWGTDEELTRYWDNTYNANVDDSILVACGVIPMYEESCIETAFYEIVV